MAKYKVKVTEILSRVVEVEASSLEEADRLVRGAYRREEIVLTADDYVETVVEVYKD